MPARELNRPAAWPGALLAFTASAPAAASIPDLAYAVAPAGLTGWPRALLTTAAALVAATVAVLLGRAPARWRTAAKTA